MAKKKRSFKEIHYILWEYYRWHILVIGLLIIFCISFFEIQLTKKTDVFTAFVVNGYYNENIDYTTQFSEYAQIDTSKNQVSIECLQIGEAYGEQSYTSIQKIATFSASQRLDLAIMDLPLFTAYAYEGLFTDLRTCLSVELLRALAENLYYIDRINMYSSQQIANTPAIISKDPSTFTDPVPIGIDVTSFEGFTNAYFFPDNDCCLGIVDSSANKDYSEKFIHFLTSE